MAGWDWEQVMPMKGHGRGTDDSRRFAALQEVQAYWQGLRHGTALPERAQIDPRGIERALEHVFLIERIAPGVARFRLAGMNLTLLMGLEVRGMPLTSIFEPAARAAVQTLVEVVFSGPAIVELALEGERGIGRPALEGRMLLLPVTGDNGICDRALGCLVTQGAVGRSPRRFAIARQSTRGVEARLAPPAPVVVLSPKLQPGLAEASTGYAKRMPRPVPSPRSRPHLRLVKSDD